MIKTMKLNNGVEMPMEGFGVFQVTDLLVCEQAVSNAIEVGYRLLDTASVYENEEAIGAAIRKSGVPREELFVTSKAYIQEMGYDNTKIAFERTLSKLGTDYLDLYCVGGEQGGIRPVLILQNDIGNHYSPTTIVCAITGKPKKPLPTHATIAGAGRLSRESFALLEQIRTIDRTRLREWVGRLGQQEMEEINQALSISVGLAPALF